MIAACCPKCFWHGSLADASKVSQGSALAQFFCPEDGEPILNIPQTVHRRLDGLEANNRLLAEAADMMDWMAQVWEMEGYFVVVHAQLFDEEGEIIPGHEENEEWHRLRLEDLQGWADRELYNDYANVAARIMLTEHHRASMAAVVTHRNPAPHPVPEGIHGDGWHVEA